MWKSRKAGEDWQGDFIVKQKVFIIIFLRNAMGYTKEEREYILSLYELSGNRITIAEKMFYEQFGTRISIKGIGYIWRRASFVKNPHGGHRHGLTEEAFRKLHGETKGNIDNMMEKTGYAVDSLRKLCAKYDLPHTRTPKPRDTRNANLYPISDGEALGYYAGGRTGGR